MTPSEPLLANSEQCILGEGPIWDATRNRLLWVDIRRGIVFTGDLEPGGTISITDTFECAQTVGAVTVSTAGDMLIAGGDALLVRSANGSVEAGPSILPPGSGRRLNDGKVDPNGQFLVGTLSLEGESEREVLVRVGHDRAVELIDDDLTLSNGLGWSSDGSRFYSVDTLRQLVYVRSYSPTGELGKRTELIRISDGSPDGMCVDAEDHLWIAMWGQGEVRRYSPDGELVHTIAVPAPHVSCVCFAGPLLDTLVITTATQDLTEAQLNEFPLSGHLFTVEPGVRGLPQTPWSGFVTRSGSNGMMGDPE